MRIEGKIIGFDEFMVRAAVQTVIGTLRFDSLPPLPPLEQNMVIDDAEEVYMKKDGERRSLGRILLKVGTNRTPDFPGR